MNKVHISLEFSGAILPVETRPESKCNVVPAKPIVDVIGAVWERQRKKISEGYLARRLGTCTVQLYWAGQAREMICIRLDRVGAFLNSLNPDQVRGAGNEDAADFLEASTRSGTTLSTSTSCAAAFLPERALATPRISVFTISSPCVESCGSPRTSRRALASTS